MFEPENWSQDKEDRQGHKMFWPPKRTLSCPFSDDSGVDMDESELREIVLSVSEMSGKPCNEDTVSKTFPNLYSCAQEIGSTNYYGFESSQTASNIQLTKTSSSSLQNIFQVSEKLNISCGMETDFGSKISKTKAKPQWTGKINASSSKTLKWFTRKFEAAVKLGKVKQKVIKTAELSKDSLSVSETDSVTTWGACRQKLCDLFGHFVLETSAHGYKRTLRDTRSSTGKVVWLMAILCVTSMVLCILRSAISEHEMYAFSSRIHSLPDSRLAFPAVTICSLAPYDASKLDGPFDERENHAGDVIIQQLRRLLKESSTASSSGSESGQPNNSSDESVADTLTTEGLETSVGWRLEDSIESCYWNEKSASCARFFIRAKSSIDSCFTFNSDPDNPLTVDQVGSLSGLGLIIKLGSNSSRPFIAHTGSSTGVKVIIHDPREFPNPREQGLLISPSETTYISFTKREYRFLPKPYKAYGNKHCSDIYPARESSSYNLSSYTGCLAECRLHKLVQACSCTVYARDPDLPNIPYCSLRQLETCYMPTLQAFHKSSYECACPLPCTKVEYQGQISTSSFHKRTTTGQRSRHLDLFVTGPGMGQGRWGTETQESDRSRLYLELRIYPDSLFTHVEEHVPTYSWSNVFGNVGGQMGLFTGASVLTLLEFLELTILVAAVLCRHGYSALRRRLSSTQGSLLPLDNGVRT